MYGYSSHVLLLRLPVPCNLSRRDLNVLVVLADTTQFGKLFHVLTTLFAKPNLCKSYLTWDFWSLRSFPLVVEVLPLSRVDATFLGVLEGVDSICVSAMYTLSQFTHCTRGTQILRASCTSLLNWCLHSLIHWHTDSAVCKTLIVFAIG